MTNSGSQGLQPSDSPPRLSHLLSDERLEVVLSHPRALQLPQRDGQGVWEHRQAPSLRHGSVGTIWPGSRNDAAENVLVGALLPGRQLGTSWCEPGDTDKEPWLPTADAWLPSW